MRFHNYKDKDISVLEKDMTDNSIVELIENKLDGSKIDVLLVDHLFFIPWTS